MNESNDQGSKSSAASSSSAAASTGKSNGRFFIFAGVLFIAALLLAAWYGSSKPVATTQPIASNPVDNTDHTKARLQTQDLQTRAMQAIASKQEIDLIPQAKTLVDNYPYFAPARTLLAQLYINEGKYDLAYPQLVKSLSLDSQQPKVQQLAGTVAQGLGKYEQASTHFGQAVGLEPNNGRYRVFLAQTFIEQMRYDDAKMTLLQALQINSNLHEAYYALSTLDAKEGRLQQAITQAGRAIEHLKMEDDGPRQAYVRWLAKLLMRDNRPDDALQVFDKLTAAQRQTPPALEDQAIAWQMLGKPERGAALYEDALALHVDQWPLALGAARWYLKANDKTNARRMVDALRRINPSAPALKDLNTQLQ